MSGVAVIRYMLAHDVNLLAAVPESLIYSGELPINTILPAISVTQISSVPRNIVSMDPTVKTLHIDRVQVSVIVKDVVGSPAGLGYPGLRNILKLVLKACPHFRGTLNTFDVDSVVADLEGPDIPDPVTATLSGSRDFFVRYNA